MSWHGVRGSPLRKSIHRYGLTVLVSAAVFLLLLPADHGTRLPPTLLFLAAVALNSWYGGLGPGVLTTAFGLAADLYLQLRVAPSTGLDHLDGVRLLVFVLVALFITWLNGKLRRTQNHLTTLIGASPQPIIAIDLEGRVRTWNPAAERMLGWTAAEVLGRLPPIVPPEGGEARQGIITQTVHRQGVRDVEVRRQRKDGSEIDLLVSTAPLYGLRGEPQGIVGIYTNITERKRAEEALRESEERYRGLFESAHDVIFTLDLERNFTSINRAGERVSGYTRDEVLQMNVGQIVASEYLDLVQKMLQQKLADHRVTTYELEIVTKDGRRVPLEVTTQLVCRHGVPVGVQGIARDVTERKQAAEALRASAEFNHAVIANAREGIIVYDRQLCYVLWNPYMEQLTGLTGEEVRGKCALDLFPHLHEHGIDKLLRRALAGETVRSGDIPFRVPSTGKTGWTTGSYAPQRDANGQITGVIGVITDVTERKRAEVVLTTQAETLRAQAELLDLAHDAIFVRDVKTSHIRFWNRGAEETYGWAKDEALGQISYRLLRTQFLQPLDAIEAEVMRTGRWEGELVHTGRDGSRIVVASRWALQRSAQGEPSGILEINSDITERKRVEEQLRHQALHDTLTGLPNRTLLQDRLQQVLLADQRKGTPCALLLLDLDRFKEINDALGHSYGDLLLQQIGPRLQHALRESDTVARLGGDEFAIVLAGVDERAALKVAAKLHRALERPFEDEEHSLHVEASIGIAVYPEHGTDVATLLRHADIAMYAAKRTKSASLVYRPDQDRDSPAQLALMGELRRAIEQDQLTLYYQPQAHMPTGCAEHVEALVRWQHPQHGFVPPNGFILLAEQTGLIEPLTRWVLTEALHQCKAWHDAGLDIRVTVNLSARNLLSPDLPRLVARLLRTHEVQPAWLDLEITESAVMVDPVRALQTLTKLHEMGLRISIDDFGSGYSSLSYLKRLPVDAIKIDKSFVLDMLRDESAATIVRSTIRLGHELGLRVVAEGVENQETWELLADMGCDMAQGYYLSRPLPPDECSAWLRRRSALTSSDSGEPALMTLQAGVVRPLRLRRRG